MVAACTAWADWKHRRATKTACDTPVPPRPAVVDVSWGYLNIRDRPDPSSAVLARAYDGARLVVINQWQGWYVVRFDNIVGWASSDFITLV